MFIQPYLATVTIFAGNFAPLNWMFCQGQLLPISEYDALFNLIGTTYGGDGQSTFALPNLSGRMAIHAGQGPGLSNYVIGQMSGTESVTLVTNQMPSHSHGVTSFTGNPPANSGAGSTDNPANAVPALINTASLYNSAPSGSVLGESVSNSAAVPAGNNQPVDLISPYLAMNYIICVQGIYPTQG